MQLQDLDNLAMPWPEEGRDWDGLPMARVGLRAALYFGNGHSAELRRELLAIVERYIGFAGGRIRAYQRAGDRARQVASPDKPVDLGRLRDRVENFKTDWSIELSSEPDVNVASHWSLVSVADHAGYLLLHFPVSAFTGAEPGAFRTLFRQWCDALKVQHAYAGLGFALPVGGRAMSAALRRCGPYATRFVGLDLDYPNTVASRCRDGIRTVNWLTAIDAARLRRVGGAETVARVAGPEVQAVEYGQGTIFVAGQAPQLGDVETANLPAAYVQLGHAVAPLRADMAEAWFEAPSGYEAPDGFAAKSGWRDAEPSELPALHYTQAWLARFG